MKDFADEREVTKSKAYEILLDVALDYRPPTDEETEHLLQHLVEDGGYYREEAEQMVNAHTDIVVLDPFVSDSPGYVGPLIFAVYRWSRPSASGLNPGAVHGYPATYTLYRYEDRDARTLAEVQQEA